MTTINVALVDLTGSSIMSRAVKILTAPGIAAVGASTRQGLLVTSSFPGRQRVTNLPSHRDSSDWLKTSLKTDATHHLAMTEIASPQREYRGHSQTVLSLSLDLQSSVCSPTPIAPLMAKSNCFLSTTLFPTPTNGRNP